MTHIPYRFQVAFASINAERRKELAEVIKILNPKTGKDWVKALIKQAEGGEQPIVHQSNSKADAYRVGMAYQNAGAEVLIHDLLPGDDEDEAEEKMKPGPSAP